MGADRQWRYRRATPAWGQCDQPLAMAVLESTEAEQRTVSGYTASSVSCSARLEETCALPPGCCRHWSRRHHHAQPHVLSEARCLGRQQRERPHPLQAHAPHVQKTHPCSPEDEQVCATARFCLESAADQLQRPKMAARWRLVGRLHSAALEERHRLRLASFCGRSHRCCPQQLGTRLELLLQPLVEAQRLSAAEPSGALLLRRVAQPLQGNHWPRSAHLWPPIPDARPLRQPGRSRLRYQRQTMPSVPPKSCCLRRWGPQAKEEARATVGRPPRPPRPSAEPLRARCTRHKE